MYDIITDAEKGISALVDTEFGRALGPIMFGDNAEDILEKFAGIHGVDPATVPPALMEQRWDAFTTALAAPVEDAEGEVRAFGSTVETAAHEVKQALEGKDPTPPAATATSEPAAEPAATEALSGTADATDIDKAALRGGQDGPITQPKEGYVVCPTCDGWGETVSAAGTVLCTTCRGAGEIPVEAHPTGTQATA